MTRSSKQEIEVKLRVENAAEMRRRLRRLGGRVERRVYESNTLFDTSRGTLRKQGKLLRLREEQRQGSPRLRSGQAGAGGQGSLRFAQGKQGIEKKRRTRRNEKAQSGARYVVTIKGPGQREDKRGTAPPPSAGLGTSGRRRYESARYKVREEMEFIIADPRAFLALAGQEGLQPSFRYEKYRTSYRVPGAGAHVEFDETPAGVFLELEGLPRAIDRVARWLGFGPEEYITMSYAALNFEKCRRRGARAGDMMFESRKK